jgi:hypothetical protein
MGDRHKNPPLRFRPPEPERTWLTSRQEKTGEAMNAILTEAVRRLMADADLREQIAAAVEAIADNYPEDVFPPDSTTVDAIAAKAMRHAYRNAARTIREGDGDG